MRDEWFIRSEVPMTKSEVRAVAVSKLELTGESVLLDIGAGTGSVSVEAALTSPVKKVYAFEKDEEAIELIEQNREKAEISRDRLTVVRGTVPEVLNKLTENTASHDGAVTHAFIGGTSGNMEPVIAALFDINPFMRVVINVVALETLAQVTDLLNRKKIDAEIVSVQISKAKKTGRYHLMQSQNPVYVISFGGKDGN